MSHDGSSEPKLVLDAGTGIRRVTNLLDGNAFDGSVLLSHLHWDHTQGLPFFSAGDRPDSRVDVFVPVAEGADPTAVLARGLSPPHFPIDPNGLLGTWRYAAVPIGEFEVEGFQVLALEIPHKGGLTVGYRVSDSRSAIAYLPDHSPLGSGAGADGMGELHENALRLADGVDVLVHDAHHTRDELARWAHYGHSAAEYAALLAGEAGAKRALLFHHSPARTDDEVDALCARVRAMAPEGVVVDVAF